MVDLSFVSLLGRLQDFMESWRFPAFLLAVLGGWPLLLLAMLAVPEGDSELAAFSAQFRVWCLGYDPATGEMEVAYAVMLVVNPLMLIAVVLAVWRIPLIEGWRRHRGVLLGWSAAGLLLVLGLGAGLTLMGDTGPTPLDGPLPFPAEALRTSHIPPSFDLVDQRGRPVRSADLEGKVTLVTAIYASCPHTCPIILAELKRAVEGLPDDLRGDVQVWAVTMDPAHDGPEQLSELGERHGLDPSVYRLLSGPEERVGQLLDRLNVARTVDMKSGVINHSNQFILIDRSGKIAYRLSLGPQQRRWLGQALELLAREDPRPKDIG